MITDFLGDTFARLKNAAKAKSEAVTVPHSKLAFDVLNLLKNEGFLSDVAVENKGKKKFIYARFKYSASGRPLLEHISRVSRPGQRIYQGVDKLTPMRNGLGFRIVSTSKGIMSDKGAREAHVGGEVLGMVW